MLSKSKIGKSTKRISAFRRAYNTERRTISRRTSAQYRLRRTSKWNELGEARGILSVVLRKCQSGAADQGHYDDGVWQGRFRLRRRKRPSLAQQRTRGRNDRVLRCFFSVAVADSTTLRADSGGGTGAIRMYYACEMARFPRNHWYRAAPG